MTHLDPAPLKLTSLQLAWLRELGIEKPWLPAAPPRQIAVSEVSERIPEEQTPSEGDQRPSSIAQIPKMVEPVVAPSVRPAGQASPRPSHSPRAVQSLTKESAVVTRGGATETMRIAAAAQSLDALAEGVASCQACGLCLDRAHVVVGQGVMQPAVMVVGEAPGEQEDRQGEPFVGRSGMLLDNMLSTIDCGRDKNVYVANMIKCRPPGNRNPRPEELSACKPFLLRQIELIKPSSILAVGKHAAQALLGVDVPLVDMREQAYTLPHPGHTVPVIVTYHPAYLLRRPSEKAQAWKDLNQLRALVRAMTGEG